MQRGDGAVVLPLAGDRAAFVLQFVAATSYKRQECKENGTMAHVPIDHTARLGVLFTHYQNPVQCELTFAVEDPTDTIFSDPAAYTSNVYAEVVNHLVPASSVTMIYTGITFEDCRAVPYVGADYPLASTPGGIALGTAHILPTNAALSVKRITAAVGRGGRGRLYFPVWTDAEIDTADVVKAARAATIVAALGAFQVAVEALVAGSHVVVVSTEFNKLPRSPGVTNPVTAWGVADLYIDTQRRRLLGRGR